MRADARARAVDTRTKDEWGPVYKGSKLRYQEALAPATTLSGATTTIASLVPANRIILGVFLRVQEEITSATGVNFDIGDGTTVNLWGDAVAFTAGTETSMDDFLDDTAVNLFLAAAGDVVLTCNVATTFSGGVVRVGVAYLGGTANIRR